MYEPNPFNGISLEEISSYLTQELYKISDALRVVEIDEMRFKVHTVEPDKPREGQVYAADGTNWDPGYGAGPYYYTGAEYLPLITPPTSEKIIYSTLVLSSFAPSFINSSIVYRPSFGGLNLTSYAPKTFGTSKTFAPGSNTLTLTGF